MKKNDFRANLFLGRSRPGAPIGRSQYNGIGRITGYDAGKRHFHAGMAAKMGFFGKGFCRFCLFIELFLVPW